MKIIFTWVFERLFEIVMISVYLVALEFFSPVRVGFEHPMYAAILPLLFYALSGYGLSCAYFGLIRRATDPMKHAMTMSIAYMAHFCIFFLMFHNIGLSFLVPLGLVGLPCVFVGSWIGARRLIRK
jgi:hypothetical protein